MLFLIRPGPLVDCSMSNISDHSLSLSCIPGSSGGSPVLFLSHLLLTDSKEFVANISNSVSPEFVFSGLKLGTSYTAVSLAVNDMGRGPAVTTRGTTLKLAEKRTALESKERVREESGDVGLVTLLGLLVGVVIALASTATVAILVVKRRGGGGRRRYDSVQMEGSNNGGEMERLSSAERKSPDVVSSTNGAFV